MPKLKGVETLGNIQDSIFCGLSLRIVSAGPMAHVRLAPHLSRMCRQFLHFFLSFYDASIVLLRNLGTTKMDPQNKCFFHANFYFKPGFWPTSLQRKIMKFAQVFFQTYQRREKCNKHWSLYRNSDIWYLENKRMTLLKKWNLYLFHLLVQKYFDHAHIFLTMSTIFWTLSL